MKRMWIFCLWCMSPESCKNNGNELNNLRYKYQLASLTSTQLIEKNLWQNETFELIATEMN